MKIIFLGTPKFACLPLQNLINNKEFEILAAYTREPAVANRGQKITKSPINDLALKNNIKVITPKTLRNLEIQQEFKSFKPDIAVVVAYGLILPKEILEIPKFGCINIHPSLLPKWRGASPIQRPIMNQETRTGVSIIKMDENLDSGDIINEEVINILPNDDYISLSQKLSEVGSKILIKTLNQIKNGEAKYQKQNHNLATYAKKIEKSECKINWQNSAEFILHQIRALNGSLSAYFELNGEKIKIYKAEIISYNSQEFEPGKIIDKNFTIQCSLGQIRPVILQRPGKRAMELKEFLLGFNFS